MQTENKVLAYSSLMVDDCNILRESVQENDNIVDCIGDLLFVIDKNRVIIKVNKSVCKAFKKKPEELIGKHCYEIVHGLNKPWCNCPATKTLETKQTATEEVIDPNVGLPLLVTTSPIFDDRGEVAKFIHIAKDITKIKLAEMELHIAANLFDAASDSILVHDLDGRLVYFNEAAYKTRGYTRDEFQRLSIQDLEVPGNPRFFGFHLRKLIDKGEATFESLNLRKDKTGVPVEIRTQIIESDGRKLVLSVARDISKRKEAEKKLKESEEKYQTTFESSMDAIMLLDEKSFFDCNKSTLQLFGCKSVEKFKKYHLADLSPLNQPDGSVSVDSANSHIRKAYSTGKDHYSWVHERIDGTTFPADVLLTKMSLKGREVLQATVRDITQQREAEEKLKQAEEKQRVLLNSANVLIQSVDADGKYSFVNEEWKKVLAYNASDLKEITIMNVVRKDQQQHCMNVFQEVMHGMCARDVETVFVSKDGREIVVSGNVCPIIRDGKFISTVAFFVDITERKGNEEKLRESSRRIKIMNEKLRVIGSLTRHDVRNKLSTVTGYAYLLKKRHKDLADVVDGLSKMEQAVNESMKIFDFAKMYEQIGVEELTYIDVEEKINEAKALFSAPIPTIINGCRGLTVLADSFLRQLFFNLVDNTRKYGKKTTTIKVYFERMEQNGLELIYEDDGVGISFENKKNLFKEGFSTGGSTGFGLFLTKQMMEVYGWQIQENGKPGEGAKFIIIMPKINQKGQENFRIKDEKT